MAFIRGPKGELIRAPHLAKWDAEIFQKYILKEAGGILELAFDVPLPPAGYGREGYIEPIQTQWEALKAKRVDVLIKKIADIYVCEVKPQAGAMAVGQVLMYCELYKKYYPTKLNVIPLIITDELDPDVLPLCGLHKILTYNTNQN